MVDKLTKMGEECGMDGAGGSVSGKDGVTDQPGAGEISSVWRPRTWFFNICKLQQKAKCNTKHNLSKLYKKPYNRAENKPR